MRFARLDPSARAFPLFEDVLSVMLQDIDQRGLVVDIPCPCADVLVNARYFAIDF